MLEGKFNVFWLVFFMMWCFWGCWFFIEGSYIDFFDEKLSNIVVVKIIKIKDVVIDNEIIFMYINNIKN